VVVDPGHDRLANLSTEPNGPGSATRKIYDGGGTHGVVTGIAEPDLTLAVSLRLRELLQRAGVKVVMTRTRTSGESSGTRTRSTPAPMFWNQRSLAARDRSAAGKFHA